MPYCATASKPLFHTNVTSQALVADNLQERKAETALPPTVTRQSNVANGDSDVDDGYGELHGLER